MRCSFWSACPNPSRLGPTLGLAGGLLSLFLFLPVAFAQENASAEPVSQHREFHFRQVQEKTLRYLVQFPEGYSSADTDKKWPLLLFLHGAGERGNDLDRVAFHGPPKERRNGTDLPFIIVSPQCPSDETWQDEPLLGLIDEVCRNHPVDTDRIYLTGLSMGGYGTWSLGLRHAERFAAMAPICGGGRMIDALLASRRGNGVRRLPIWAFHGAKDPVIPVDESERMVAALKRVGHPSVRLTIYPEADHDSWTETYANPEFYEWLLNHTLKESEGASARQSP